MKSLILNIFIFVASLGLIPTTGFGQWTQDFSTDDLSIWSGDIADFVINDNERLQLNAPEAGETYIYRPSTIDFDTVTFKLLHVMDFAPSDNNKSRIYLALDNEDFTMASGYFIEIGENGSDDALKFYYLEGGVEFFIASASMGAMAAEPAVVRLQIDVYPDGLWSVRTNYEGDEFTSLEFEFLEDQFSLKNSQFFGLYCKYSASRADKFFYDDASIQRFERDTSPPQVIQNEIIDANTIRLTFNEPVDQMDATMVANYLLNNESNPIAITMGGIGDKYQLEFAESFNATITNILSVAGISDLNENEMDVQEVSFLFADEPNLGDLLLSEILFDPYTGGEDFVELYNGSIKNLELKGITIRNDQRDESKMVTQSLVMPPQSYLALTEEVDFLFQEYKPDAGANIEFQELPAFNNEEGNVMLLNQSGVVLDSFDYHVDQHFQLLDDTEGVSLERVSFEVASDNENNWQSGAENVRFATPGYKNSNLIPSITGEEIFGLVTEIFSPNQDGEDDQMILSYTLDKVGYVANFSIHDAAGFKIKELNNNELLGLQGIITWDGTGDDNLIADIGIYIIVGKLFHPDGDVLNVKLSVVLADFID
ncbi:MAG: hypothetical protein AAGA77_08390 [Bacteroidota bacterium]